jgi:hypothetical protein
MVAGMVQGRPSAVSDPFHGAAKDRARARLRQPGDGYRQLEAATGPIFSRMRPILLDLSGGPVHARL